MNNFVNFSRKFNRDILERGVLKAIKKVLPHAEQYTASYRFPVFPKIVLYSSTANSQSFLQQIFPQYSFIAPSTTEETDEIMTLRIAEQLNKAEDDLEGQVGFGYVLNGFPFNTNQALLLDKYLNGVNLAIYCKSAKDSEDFSSSVKPLLDYYNERGTLIELTHSSEPTLQEITQAQEAIKINIKRNM